MRSGAHAGQGDWWDEGAEGSGAVYVFRRSGAVWRQEAYIKASNTGMGDAFGESVALAGDTLVVGASREASAATGVGGDQTSNSAPQSGAVYVFRRSGTSWQQEAYIKASNTGASDWFGQSVALAGDALVVGAPREDSAAKGVDGDQSSSGGNIAEDSGAAYVFRRDAVSWQPSAYVKASNTKGRYEFGESLALSEDTLVIGVAGEDSGLHGINPRDNPAVDDHLESGAVYIFH